jgi:bifunctional DNA-binding transcriptional regulator/antitoxin component of YhaV-PrlF toxin-antitoxin module
LVIPKSLRDRVGLRPGVVEITIDGAGLRVEPLAGDDLEERDGLLLVPRSGAALDDDLVRGLRDADRR